MTTPKLLLNVFVLAILGGLAYLLFTHKQVPATLPENLPTETTSTPEISFNRPENFGLALRPEQILVESYIPPCDTDFDYCLYYIGQDYVGTNFESAGVRIKKRADLADATSCLNTPPAGYNNLTPVTQATGSYTTALFTPLNNAGAGHFARGELYRLSFNNTCYEFEIRIGQSQFANYEPGTIREFTTNDYAKLAQELQTLLDRMTITSTGESIVFPTIR